MTTQSMDPDRVATLVADALRSGHAERPGRNGRVRPAAETVAVVRRHARDLGITRIGLVTGLDRLGLPIGFAVRPNSRSLSVHQGKGADTDAALASAAMEAAEVSLAERPPATPWTASLQAAETSSLPVMELARTTRCQPMRIDRMVPLRFVVGYDIAAGQPVLVPWDLVGIDHCGLAPDDPIDRSSDGLASGNTLAEAMLHGLQELVERDAAALFESLPHTAASRRKLHRKAFGSTALDGLDARLGAAGLDLSLFDMTSDIGLPAVSAMLVPARLESRPDLTRTALCGGYGCHEDPAIAAMKAATEACQARLTAIAGARDDMGADLYARVPSSGDDRPDETIELAHAPAVLAPRPASVPADASLGERLDRIVAALAAAGLHQVVAVPIPSGIPEIHVVRMIVPGLEIGPGAPGRQIGRRLLASYLRNAAA